MHACKRNCVHAYIASIQTCIHVGTYTHTHMGACKHSCVELIDQKEGDKHMLVWFISNDEKKFLTVAALTLSFCSKRLNYYDRVSFASKYA